METAPNPQLRILSIGNDGVLLWVRSLIFRQSGHYVCSLSASDFSLSKFDCDVVVFCSSVEIELAKAIARRMKVMRPAVRTISLSNSAFKDENFDAVVDPISGPGPLLAELNRIRGALMPHSADSPDGVATHSSQTLSNPNCQETCSSGPFHSTKSGLRG